MKRKALGKGIESLIPQSPSSDKLAEVDISRIKPSPYQPRRRFDPEKLAELAASIRNSGIIQPVVLARETDGSPVEEALAYKSLLERYQLTQEELSGRLGKKRSSITNMLRILRLPEEVLAAVEDGQVSFGHAKILSGITDTSRLLKLAGEVVEKGLTVRALESRLKTPEKTKVAQKKSDVFLQDGEERLSKKLGTGVKIKGNAGRGSIIIQYHSKEQLISLFESLMQR